MAYLVAVGAIMMGCSKAEESLLPEDMNNNNSVILSTTVGFDAEAETRALGIDYVNKQAVKTFAAGETMAIIYKNKSGNTVNAVSAALTDGDITTTADPATNKKSATFTFELTAPDKTQAVTYIYPTAMANSDGSVNYAALATQDGTLGTLSSSLDLATYTHAWNGTSLPAGTLVNQLAVCALTLKNSDGSSPITSGLTQVTVSDGDNTYTVAPTSDTFGEDVIYVAIRPVTAALQYTATAGTYNYTKTATSRAYTAGNFYNLGLRITMGHALSASAVGELVASDGLAYAAAAKNYLPENVTGQAVVCYKSGNNGIALALVDYASGHHDGATGYGLTTWSGNHPVSGQNWKLLTRAEFVNIYNGCGGSAPSAIYPNSGYAGTCGTLNTSIIPNAGGTAMSGNYWVYDTYSNGYVCTNILSATNCNFNYNQNAVYLNIRYGIAF